MHYLAIFLTDIKCILLIELGHESCRTTLVDLSTDPVIVLESAERAVFVGPERIAIVESESPIALFDNITLYEFVTHPTMYLSPSSIGELEVAANWMVFVGSLCDGVGQEVAYALENFFLVLGIVDADADPVAFPVPIQGLIETSHSVDACAIALYLNSAVGRPQTP